MLNRFFLFVKLLLIPVAISFSQTAEPGEAFNRFMSPQAGVNLLSGTVAFSKPLVQISSGGVSTSFDLAYSSNVFRAVQTRNDQSPGSWVGLGWALGRATILCDHRGTITLDDDSYSLLLPTGVRYQFVRDGSGKWWVEQQPYWQLERITKTAQWYGKSFTIATGWKITDESGLVSYYGDYDENPSSPVRNATQHDLSWPEGPGLVGYAVSGKTALHPSAWNLRRQEDLEGNWVEYDYEQVSEKLKVRQWTSAHGYTKECYLKTVRASTGASMKFILGDKGEGEFLGEYWDSRGEFEAPDSDPDAFIDPLERKFLSAIEVYGTDGRKTGRIDLCYKALKIRPGGRDAEGYTKRLLIAVVHSDADGIETDREDYDYYTNAEKASASTVNGARREPLGALYRVRGPNCGMVDYNYGHYSLSKGKDGIEAHAQTLNLGSKKLAMGYLADGTQYLVGMDGSGYVKVFNFVGGEWLPMPVNFGKTFKPDDASILIGDQGWFAIFQPEGATGSSVIPVVWDSEKWVVNSPLNENTSRETVWAGPDYLVHLRAASNKISLEIPWSRWGKTYSFKIPHVDDNSQLDRDKIRVAAGKNHIVVTYIRNDLFTPNSKAFVVLTFAGDELVETAFAKDLDNDNNYYLAGDYFYGLEEATGLTGYYSSAWHWNGKNWSKWLDNKELNGWQGELENMASGVDYYAVRHNDEDDLTLFDWDGEYWSRPYKNENLVGHDDFDLFVESNWHARAGNYFFVTMQPRNVWERLRVCYPVVRRWKVRKKCSNIPYWQSTHSDAYISRYEKREGQWTHTGKTDFSCPNTSKTVLTGQDWYTVKPCARKAWIWDSQTWREESLADANILDEAKSLGSGFFYKQLDNDAKVKIYRKLDDSFIKSFGAFVVIEKTVSDPVTDQIHSYKYNPYIFTSSEGSFAFDGPNNTPLVNEVHVVLPEGAGTIRQIMCDPRKDARAGMGQVCREETLDALGRLASWTEYAYTRFRSDRWPRQIYVDRLAKTKGISGGLRTENSTEYNYLLNGQPSKVVQISGNKQTEARTIYAAEQYESLKNKNRLTEVAASYTCIPSCNASGKIAQASAVRYGTVSGTTVPYALENWNWEPDAMQSGSSFSFNWNSPTQSNRWKKVNTITRFDRGRAVETVDRLGLSSAVFHENNAMALLYGKVTGSRQNATLLIPGESCEIAGLNNCELIELQGNATQGNGLNYGRFSAQALLTPVTATLAGSAGGVYRFSAWVQGVDLVDRTLRLSLNGLEVQAWTLAGNEAGHWRQVQWEGPLSTGNVNVALSLSQGSRIRVQDMRLQPYDALASVTFWDRRQGIPLVQVDERGVGSYVELDASGRVQARYTEDVAGRVFLSQRFTYSNANCKENGQGRNRLARLKINGTSVPLPTVNGEQTYILPDGESEFAIQWTLSQKRDQIRYQLYPEGGQASAVWVSACCGEIEAASGDATVQKSWILRLDVEPFNSNGQADYTIRIQKDATGWTDHGGPPITGIGSFGRYTGNQESGRIVLRNHTKGKILQEAVFDGNTWQTNPLTTSPAEEFHVIGSANVRYMTWLSANTGESSPEFRTSIMGSSGNSWSDYGFLAESENVDLLRVALDAQNLPWALYRRAMNREDPGSLQAIRWNAMQNIWEEVGSLPLFRGEESIPYQFQSGRVSERSPVDADMVLGGDGYMYVAYIGSIASLGNASAAARGVVVKRLYSSSESRMDREIWAGPSLVQEEGEENLEPGIQPNYDGDILMLNDDILMGARQIRLAVDAGHLYLAVVYAVETDQEGTLAVTVFKGTMLNNIVEDEIVYPSRLVFEPLTDASVRGSSLGVPLEEERNRAFYLKSSDPFDFVVRQGTPYLSFANAANRQRTTVIYHNGSRWLSVGNPAFAPLVSAAGQLDLSVDSQKKPYVVFKEGLNSSNAKRRNRVVPMKYVAAGDRDLTLNAVDFSGVTTSLASAFRQYILYYQAKFDSKVTQLKLAPTPRTLADIVGIQIENNGSLIGSWVVSPNSSEAKLYMSGVTATYSGTSVPAFDIALAEGLNTVVVKIFGKNGKQLLYTFELSREFLPKSGFGTGSGGGSGGGSGNYEIVPTTDSVCVWFSTGWFLQCGDSIYYSNACFEWDKENTTECTLNGEDTTETVIINPEPGGGGDGDEGGGTGVLPPELRPWSGYALFAGENLNLADRVTVERGPAAAGSRIEVGADAAVRSGDLISGGGVWLRNRANVQNIILSGNLDIQHGATYASMEQKNVDLSALPVLSINPGTENKTIGNDQQVSMEPGRYDSFHAYSRSVVSFAPGDYYFSSFVLEPDVKLEFGTSEYGVRIWVQGELRLADRVVLENLGTPEKLLLYTNSSGNIRLGVGNALRAIVVAPMGSVDVPSRITYTSSIWAKNITVQPDTQFQ